MPTRLLADSFRHHQKHIEFDVGEGKKAYIEKYFHALTITELFIFLDDASFISISQNETLFSRSTGFISLL
jgi:hypothetical protein